MILDSSVKENRFLEAEDSFWLVKKPIMSDDADEPTIPRAALNKLIKDNAPQIRVANETRDLLHACCLEFVKFVGAEANRICAQEQRKTISHEHASKAFETLGFGAAYQEAALSVLDECKEAAQKRLMRQNSRLDKCGIPEDELLKQQQELFEKARAEQAEVEQSQLASFQRQIELAQQEKRENGTNDVPPLTAPPPQYNQTSVIVDMKSTVPAPSQQQQQKKLSNFEGLQLDEDYDSLE